MYFLSQILMGIMRISFGGYLTFLTDLFYFNLQDVDIYIVVNFSWTIKSFIIKSDCKTTSELMEPEITCKICNKNTLDKPQYF